MNSGKIVAGRGDGWRIEGSTRGPRGPKKGKSNCPFSSDIGANCKSQDRYYSNHHKLKVTKEIELPGMRREGLDCIRARSWSQTIPIVSAPHVLKIQILAQNVFAMRVVFLHSSQSILGPGSKEGARKEIWVSPLLPHLVSSPFGSVALAVSVFIRWWEQSEEFSHAPSHLGWTTRKYGSAKVFSKSVSTTRGSLR